MDYLAMSMAPKAEIHKFMQKICLTKKYTIFHLFATAGYTRSFLYLDNFFVKGHPVYLISEILSYNIFYTKITLFTIYINFNIL